MIILRTLGEVYDITKYTNYPYVQNENITGLFDSSTLTLIAPKTAFMNLDLSRKIPLSSLVEITDLEKTTQYYVEKSTFEKVGSEYKHTINLIETLWLTKERLISNYTITQPIKNAETIITETSKIESENFDIFTYEFKQEFNLEISQISNDINYIENRAIKETGEYNISLSTVFGKINGLFPRISEFKLFIYANDRLIGEKNFGSFGVWSTIGNLAFGIKANINSGETITAKMSAVVSGIASADVNLKSGFLTIDKVLTQESSTIYMDQVVDKILTMTNVSAVPEFRLDEISRVRLSRMIAYDDVATELTLYDALQRIASFVKARARVKVLESGKFVYFEFYDEMSLQDYVPINTINEISTITSDDYASALALSNNNVIRENVLIERGTIRSSDNSTNQITTNNITFLTTHLIDKIKSLKIIGKEVKDTANVVVLSNNEWLDITLNVLEKAHYDTLDKMANYDNRFVNNQNNHIYYERGKNQIMGLSFVGTQFETFNPSNSNRAIYETIATVLQRLHNDKTIKKFLDGGLTDDMDLEYIIEYYPLSQTHALVFKDDQSGFQEQRIMRINANDRVNNAEFLGDYTRTKINSLGGTVKGGFGIAKTPLEITKLGTVSPENERVVSITKHSYMDEIRYYPTLVKDYVFQSHYIGIDKDRRLYHVPRDEYVKRVDKSLNIIFLSSLEKDDTSDILNSRLFMEHLTNGANKKLAPKVALLSFDEKDITAKVDVGAVATTVEWYIEMIDNFSAGVKRKTVELSDKTFHYQHGVPYSDLFGRVKNLMVNFKELQDTSKLSLNEFPDGNLTLGDMYSQFFYELEKDAREQYALSFQVSILSEDNQVYVFNGMGKYNLMSKHILEANNINLAILNYRPNRDDKFIDLGQITPAINNATLNSRYVEVDLANAGQGYAFYEKTTGELLLAYVGNVEIGKHRIYYRQAAFDANTNYLTYMNLDDLYFTVQASIENVNVVSQQLGAIIEFTTNYYQLPVSIINTDITLIAGIENVKVEAMDLSANISFGIDYYELPVSFVSESFKVLAGIDNVNVKPQDLNAVIGNDVNIIDTQMLKVNGSLEFIATLGTVKVNAQSLSAIIGLDEDVVSTAVYKTAKPTVSDPFCYIESGQRNIYVSLTNNDANQVRIENFGSTINTLNGYETKNVRIDFIPSLPTQVSWSIVAIADGKDDSDAASGSYIVRFCST